jgi:hypothetical protein
LAWPYGGWLRGDDETGDDQNEVDQLILEIGQRRHPWHGGDQVGFCNNFEDGLDRIGLAADLGLLLA